MTLDGARGVLVRVYPVADWTEYSAPQAFKPGYPALREALLTENFEAVQQWGLGVNGTGCVSVHILDSPHRLVVDIQS